MGQASMKGGPVGDRDPFCRTHLARLPCLNEGRSRWGPRHVAVSAALAPRVVASMKGGPVGDRDSHDIATRTFIL